MILEGRIVPSSLCLYILRFIDLVVLNRNYFEVETRNLCIGINGLFEPQNESFEPLPRIFFISEIFCSEFIRIIEQSRQVFHQFEFSH